MREVLSDLDTPLSVYLKLADGPHTYLFDHDGDGRIDAEITDLGRKTVGDATETLNREVFGNVGMSDDEMTGLVGAIQSLRKHNGDF